MSRDGRWDDMADVIDDSMLDSFAVVAEPADVPARLAERFGGLADRLQIDMGAIGGRRDALRWAPILADVTTI